jgi:hypothetical protein
VGAERLPQLLVPTLADQVQVHLAEGRQVAVRLVDDRLADALVGDGETVVGHLRRRQDGDPDAVVLVLHRHAGAVGEDDRDRTPRTAASAAR